MCKIIEKNCGSSHFFVCVPSVEKLKFLQSLVKKQELLWYLMFSYYLITVVGHSQKKLSNLHLKYI